MVDDNVHPTNAWKLVDKLQDAGLAFDLMFHPNSGHGLAPHWREVRWRYLREHLGRG